MKPLVVMLLAVAAASGKPVHLRCNYRENPLGIDDPTPRFSWQSNNTERNWRQAAYQITVTDSSSAPVWDSGRRESPESVGIVYGGPKPQPGHRYYWTVRVWDSAGAEAASEEKAWWEAGLLERSGWTAKWIAWKNPEEAADEAGIRWISADGGGAAAHFRLTAEIGERPRSAQLYIAAKDDFRAEVNGREVDSKHDWNEFDRVEIADLLTPGRTNTIDVTVNAKAPHTATMAALLKITRADGTVDRFASDSRWQARLGTDQMWKPAEVAGQLGDPKMGRDPRPLPQPASLMRREFTLAKPVRSARLYATALGSYRIFINGRQAGHDVLTPDYTDYRKRVLYQTYDVTRLLAEGRNAVGAELGDGWFGSAVAWGGVHFFYLPPPARLIAQLEVEFADGTHQTIGTDDSWRTAASPIRRSEIYAGETYDARLEQRGWDRAGFNDRNWTPAVIADGPPSAVTSQSDAPVQVVDEVRPIGITQPSPGAWVFDMGQNMVGWTRLRVKGRAGQTVRLRFAEILKPDGNIYTQNLRNADATDTYILHGGAVETYEPHFTFHGFRYVEVTGYPGKPKLADLTGEVVSSLAGDPVAHVTTSSDLVSRMWKIGIWGQRGNFLSIPTDCPQRDERLGWMGDAGVFWRTGAYNFDIAAFSEKWMRDVTDAQSSAGAFTNISPDLGFGEGAPGWGDAGVIVPWTTWLQYGDKAIVARSWDAMERWMKYIQDGNPDCIRRKRLGPNYGDWLAPNSDTPKDLIGTAYWALIAQMMVDMAHALDREADAKRYAALYDQIRAAFQKAWIKDDGTVGNGSQTCYVLALHMKLLPDSLRGAAVDRLVQDIKAHNGHLTTGFLGTPFLLFALANNGRADIAYQLLLNDTYPSWGYMLKKGATTWWERWNGDTGDPAMNSYNHYAFGSVVAWVYRSVAGIDTVPAAPGFREIVIHPRLDGRITQASGDYESIYGRIATSWRGSPKGPFTLKVSIPANTTARVCLPVVPNAHVTERGKPIEGTEVAGCNVVRIGSGTYEFAVR
ncbi:MAG TPA: family 78 glycoside hydrolase catalytic domain [Bryobacteraceae bacterium]|nr:family 78 glycoside hydrolase catalytic domain [Bryobacteraceae bacterium]